MKPVIIVNFKAYEEATGKNALKLAKIIENVSKSYDAEFIIAVQAVDISEITKNTHIKVFVQHAEASGYGKYTGHVTLEAVKHVGASGTLVNHSEYNLKPEEINKIIQKARLLKMTSVACANNVETAKKISEFGPDFIAVEPPELIGGKISVAEAKPEVIRSAVKEIKSNVLVGAGINKAEDLRIALKLGAKGILLSSAIVTADDPGKKLSELLEGLNQKNE